jgi:anti-sigma regulatory factor (Ser/Thr protein kinase)
MADTTDDNPNKFQIAQFMLEGHFRFRQLSEAYLLAQFLAAACPNPRLAAMGITEILVNAVEHGNLGISFEEKSTLQMKANWLEEINRRLNLPAHINQFVEVKLTRTETEIRITVTDQGTGFDWQRYQSETNHSFDIHGRGIFLAKSLAFKRLEYTGTGNTVTCVIDLTNT